MINQSLGSPIAGGMGRLYLRTGGPEPMILPVVGPEARCRVGAADDRFVWEGETSACAIGSAFGCIPARTSGYGGSRSSTGAVGRCPATPSSFRISASANRAS